MKKRLRLFCFFAIFLTTSRLMAGPGLLNEAMALMKAGENDKARLILEELIEIEPKSINAWFILAVIQLEQGEFEEVATVTLPKMQTLVGKKKRNISVEKVRGTLFYKQAEKLDETLGEAADSAEIERKADDLRQKSRQAYLTAIACARNKPNLDLWAFVLTLDLQLNDVSRADAHARRVLRIDEDNPRANYILGSILLNKEDYPLAESYLRRSIGGAPKPLYRALNDLAELLRRTNRLEEAASFATRATEIDPTLYTAWETLAAILLQSEKTDEAAAAIAKALARNANDPRLYITQGKILLKQNRTEEARAAYRNAIAIKRKLSAFERNDLAALALELGIDSKE